MGRAENPGCGDILELSVRVEGGRIAEARFRAKGCTPLVACGSRLTEMIEGMTVIEARRVGGEALIAALEGLPVASRHAAQLTVDALRVALGQVGGSKGEAASFTEPKRPPR